MKLIYHVSQSVLAAVTNCHRLSGLNNKQLFPIVLEAWEVQDQGAGRSNAWWRPAFLVCRWLYSLYPHMVKSRDRGSKISHVSSYKGTLIPFLRTLLSWPNYLQRPHLQMPSYSHDGFHCMDYNIWILRVCKHSVHSTKQT